MVRIIFKPEAIKRLNRIGVKDIPKVKRKLELLKLDPLAGKLLSGEFSGTRSLRAWSLRLLYSFDSRTQTITIEVIDYRGRVYK